VNDVSCIASTMSRIVSRMSVRRGSPQAAWGGMLLASGPAGKPDPGEAQVNGAKVEESNTPDALE